MFLNRGDEFLVSKCEDIDPSSIWKSQLSVGRASEFRLTVVTSDSAGTEKRLSSRSTWCCVSIDILLGVDIFFVAGAFSPPRWRLKSNSISIEDSSSVSLAEDMVVHPVAELALLSEELGELPSQRDNGNPACMSIDPFTELHFLLTPCDELKEGFKEPGKSNLSVVSVV